jgi:hypothetical protein
VVVVVVLAAVAVVVLGSNSVWGCDACGQTRGTGGAGFTERNSGYSIDGWQQQLLPVALTLAWPAHAPDPQ